jgi:hypothetical protein
MGASAIGYATGVTSNLSADLIKEYIMGSDKPTVLSSGNKTIKITCDKLYIDNTYLTQVLGGTAVDFVIGPAGTSSGKPKITIKNVVLNVWDFKAEQKGVVSEKVSGEGDDIQAGTY